MFRPESTRYIIPVSIATPLLCAMLPLYPAVWSTDKSVRQWASTVLVVGLVAALVAALLVMRKWILDLEYRTGVWRDKRMVDAALMALSTDNHPEWSDLARRLDVGEVPRSFGDEQRN